MTKTSRLPVAALALVLPLAGCAGMGDAGRGIIGGVAGLAVAGITGINPGVGVAAGIAVGVLADDVAGRPHHLPGDDQPAR